MSFTSRFTLEVVYHPSSGMPDDPPWLWELRCKKDNTLAMRGRKWTRRGAIRAGHKWVKNHDKTIRKQNNKTYIEDIF